MIARPIIAVLSIFYIFDSGAIGLVHYIYVLNQQINFLGLTCIYLLTSFFIIIDQITFSFIKNRIQKWRGVNNNGADRNTRHS